MAETENVNHDKYETTEEVKVPDRPVFLVQFGTNIII